VSGLGIVLSGGGARGAYEVGVLGYLYGELRRRSGYTPRFDVVSGTSVGAVNGTALAAWAHDPEPGLSELADVWLNQEMSDVLHFNFGQLTKLYRVWVGGGAPAGIFDSRPFARKISHRIPWRQLSRNLKSGLLRALTVSATNVATGRTTLYIDRAPGVPLPSLQARMVIRPTHILPHHVLASAAMPMIFPPVRIGNDYFCDGGIRLNTPTAPAIQLGVDRMFVIGVSTPAARPELDRRYEVAGAPGASFLFGRALNALMLDHLNHDLEEVNLVNTLLQDAITAYGEDFIPRVNAVAESEGRAARRIIRMMTVRPSLDIGCLAAEHLRTHRTRLSKLFGRAALGMLDVGEGADADLASYLLFDGDFARILIDLGRSDAAARRDELEDFLRPAEKPEASQSA